MLTEKVLEQAEQERDQWKLKACEWKDEHSKVESRIERAEGLLQEARKYIPYIGIPQVQEAFTASEPNVLIQRIDAFLRGD